MPAHVLGERAGEEIVAAAGAGGDDDGHGLAAIELGRRLGVGGRGGERQEEQGKRRF